MARGWAGLPARPPRPASDVEVVQDVRQLAPDAREVDRSALGLVVAALAHRLVEAVAGAADGEPLLVQQLADAADQQHLVVLVIPAVPAALHRLELGELLL